MAAILSVTYTPNYSGCHRICFKTTQASYCCYQDDSPAEIGVEKTIVLDLTEYAECLVDVPFQIGCNDTNLIGYVQPCCTDATSLDNRVSFATTYEPTPCTTYKVECEESGIGEITVTQQGLGWLPGQVPNVVINDSSGFGNGATAEAIMACNDALICYVESILITDSGNSYYFIDTISVTIDPPPGLGGTPAEAEVTLVDDCGTFTVPDCDGTSNPTTYQLWGGDLYAINVCAGGAGPVAPEYIVTPNPAVISYGPELVDFSPTGNLTFYGDIQWDVIGMGPFPVEVVSFEESPYVNLIVIPGILTPGSTYQIQLNAYTSVSTNDISIYAGTNTVSTGPFSGYTPIGVIYTLVSNGTDIQIIIPSVLENTYLGSLSIVEVISTPISCCTCVKYDIINTALSGPSIDVYYTDCTNQTITTITIDPQDTISVCAVQNSIWPVNPGDNQYIEYILSAIQDC